MKSLDHQFRDWNNYFIGYGYGTGEVYTLEALKKFMEAVEIGGMYDYRTLEKAVTPVAAWLLINLLIDADIIEYGTSPRHGWLTPAGNELKKFVTLHTSKELFDICCTSMFGEFYIYCCPEFCNCTDQSPCITQNRFWSKPT
jgi:hypothetical protein